MRSPYFSFHAQTRSRNFSGQALLGTQLLLNLDLGGDTGVIRAGKPQGLVALHALEAGQDVLQRTVQRVAHVQLAGDVGGRHDDGKRLLVRVRLRLEAVAVHPKLVDAGFHVPRVIDLGQFFHICTPFSVFGKTKSSLRFASAKQGEHNVRGTTCIRDRSRAHGCSNTPAPVTEGKPPRPTVSSARSSGTTWAGHHGRLHLPRPLLASADRLLLPVIADFICRKYTISAGKCQEGDSPAPSPSCYVPFSACWT